MLFYNRGMKCGKQLKRMAAIPAILLIFCKFPNGCSTSLGLSLRLVGIVAAPGAHIDKSKFCAITWA